MLESDFSLPSTNTGLKLMNNELAIELIALVKEQQAQLGAYQAVIHAILQHHPNLDVIANDYMSRMDNLATTTSPERLAEIREDWQKVLFPMTEELARRKAASTD
jgi:hypothetical protein